MTHFFQINRILLSVHNLSVSSNGANEEDVIFDLNRTCIVAPQLTYEKEIEECKKLGLIIERHARLKLTKLGKRLFELRTLESNTTNVDPNEKQKQFLLDLIFKSKYHHRGLRKIIASLKRDNEKELWYSNPAKLKIWPKSLVKLFSITDI